MLFPIANSEGSLLEYNHCHDSRGKFCSGPRHLTGRDAMRAEWQASSKHLDYDLERARRLGISVSHMPASSEGAFGVAKAQGDPIWQSHAVPDWPGVTLYTNVTRKGPFAAGASRSRDVSVLRHEIGHVTSRGFGLRPNERRVFGQDVGQVYAHELGAWKAAIRDAPFNRVSWSAVRKGLKSYLYDVIEAKQRRQIPWVRNEPAYRQVVIHNRLVTARERIVNRVVDRHVALLKRYARSLRPRHLTPTSVLPAVAA